MASCHGAYSAGVLRVICAGSPPAVPIAGEIDESSYSGLVSTLEGLADREGDVHVNLAEVAFCDLAGLRAVLWLASRKLPLRARRRPSVVCAARTLPPRRIAAEGPAPPRHLRLEGILDVLASVLETSLSLVSMSLGLQGLISGGLARTLLDLALGLLRSVLNLVLGTHFYCLPFLSARPEQKKAPWPAVQPTNFAVQLPGSGATGP